MRKQIIFILAILLIFTGLNFSKKRKVDQLKFPKMKEFKIPVIEKTKTNNGIKLRVIKSEKLPLINVVAVIRGGNVYDPATKIGLANMTAQLLRIGGTTKMDGEAVDSFLDSNGVTIRISSDLDSFTVYMSCMDENLNEAIDILSKMLKTPGFDKKKLEEIKTQFASGIQRRNDSPQPILTREFNKVIYGENTPFSAVAEYEHVDSITVNDIRNEHKRFFAPENILMGISGPVKLNEIKSLVEKYFGDWKNKAQIPPYPSVRAPELNYKIALANKDSMNQNYISIGHIGKKKEKNMQAVIKVFNSIFSQGMDSRLFNKVRTDLGLTYGIGGGIIQKEQYPGKTYFSTFTKAESTIPVLKAIFGEIDKIKKEKVSDKELYDAKNYFLNSYVFKFSTPEQILYSRLNGEFYGEDEKEQAELVKNIQKVTADDIFKLVQTYLSPDKMKIVIIGNEKMIKGKLTDFGTVKKLDISIKPPAVKEIIPEATPESLKKGEKIINNLFKTKYKGYKKLKSVNSIFDMDMSIQGRQMTLGMNSTSLYPDKSYTEISIMGMKMKRVVNGNNGIMNQMGQERPIPEKQIKDGRFGDEYDMCHNRKNYKFQYLKEVKEKGTIYDVIYIFNSDKKWKKLYINKKTSLIEMTESMSTQPMMVGLTKTINSDFKVIKGIPFAFKSKTILKDKVVSSITVKSVKVNIKVDNKIFIIKKKK